MIGQYKSIPFVPDATVTLLDDKGQAVGELTEQARLARTAVIDCGGYGVRIELEKPYPLSRGVNNTILILLTDNPAPAGPVALRYRLTPYSS